MTHTLSPSFGTHLLEPLLLMVVVLDGEFGCDTDCETVLGDWVDAGGVVGYDGGDDGDDGDEDDDGCGGGDDGELGRGDMVVCAGEVSRERLGDPGSLVGEPMMGR